MERLLKFAAVSDFVQFVDELWSRAAQFCDIQTRHPTSCPSRPRLYMEQGEIAPHLPTYVEGWSFCNDRVEWSSCCIGANHIQAFSRTVLAQDKYGGMHF